MRTIFQKKEEVILPRIIFLLEVCDYKVDGEVVIIRRIIVPNDLQISISKVQTVNTVEHSPIYIM